MGLLLLLLVDLHVRWWGYPPHIVVILCLVPVVVIVVEYLGIPEDLALLPLILQPLLMLI